MANVFLSHATPDQPLAVQVQQWLELDGHQVFLAADLPRADGGGGIGAGTEWQRRLHKQLRWADALVCLLSTAYDASSWCSAELGIAQSRGTRVLPLLAQADYDEHPLLSRGAVQHLDLVGDPVAARAGLAAELLRLDTAGGRGWPDDRSPFPGLRAFELDEHRAFFGRARDVERLATRLRSPAEQAGTPVMLVVGPSGCGKSSLVRAGLLPAMAARSDWHVVSAMRPGKHPIAALAVELAEAGEATGLAWTPAAVRERLAEEGGLTTLADDLLAAVPGTRRRHLLLVVDQVEELLAQTASDERRRFFRLLADTTSRSVHVVGTLQSEFLDNLLAHPDTAALAWQLQPLAPLGREALREVITGPAGLARITVKDELVAQMVDDAGDGEALPLLAYALDELSRDIKRGGKLSAERYEQLGGVRGMLTGQADAALIAAVDDRNGRSAEQVVRDLLRLVTVNEQNRPTRRRVPLDDLPKQVRAEFEIFVGKRLLITSRERGTDGPVMVEAAHEAFLTVWPPLAEAIAGVERALRARDGIERAAEDWADLGHPGGRLWGGSQLTIAVADTGAHVGNTAGSGGRPVLGLPPLGRHRVLTTTHVELSHRGQEFLLASVRHDRRRRHRATTILATLLVLALAAAGVAVVELQAERRQQQIAAERQDAVSARNLTTQADALIGSDPATALRLDEAAFHLSPDEATRSDLVANLATTRYAGTLVGQPGPVAALALAANGRTLATAGGGGAESTASRNGMVLLWDLTNPAGPRRIGPPLVEPGGGGSSALPDIVIAAAFTRDGATLATVDTDGAVFLWDLTDRTHPRVLNALPIAEGSVHKNRAAVAFAADNRTLAVAAIAGSEGVNDMVQLWDVTDRTQPRQIGGPLRTGAQYLSGMAFTPDGHHVALAFFPPLVMPIGSDPPEDVQLWDLTDPANPHQEGAPFAAQLNGQATAMAFTPDGRILATAKESGPVRLWDLADHAHPRAIGNVLRTQTVLTALAFSPDGHTLAIAGYDDDIVLWDLTDPAAPTRISAPLTDPAAPTSPGRNPLTGSRPVRAVAFTTDGRTVIAGTADGTTILWHRDPTGQPALIGRLPPGFNGEAGAVAYSPDGRRLVIGGANASLHLWDLSERTRPLLVDNRLIDFVIREHHADPRINKVIPPGYAVTAATFSPDGQTLAAGFEDGVVLLWDLRQPGLTTIIGAPIHAETGRVKSLAFGPTGHTLLTAGEGATTLWDISDPDHPRAQQTIKASYQDSAALAPDGRTVATAHADAVWLWDITDPAKARQLGNSLFGPGTPLEPTLVTFAPDGHTLAAAAIDSAFLWDITDLAAPRQLGAALVGQGGISQVVFSPDGRTLATGGEGSRTAMLWDFTDRARPLRIASLTGGPAESLRALVFAPDGRTLVAASETPSSLLFDVDNVNALHEDPLQHACAVTGGGLDPGDWDHYTGGLPYERSCPA